MWTQSKWLQVAEQTNTVLWCKADFLFASAIEIKEKWDCFHAFANIFMLGINFPLAQDAMNNKLAEKFPICEDG